MPDGLTCNRCPGSGPILTGDTLADAVAAAVLHEQAVHEVDRVRLVSKARRHLLADLGFSPADLQLVEFGEITDPEEPVEHAGQIQGANTAEAVIPLPVGAPSPQEAVLSGLIGAEVPLAFGMATYIGDVQYLPDEHAIQVQFTNPPQGAVRETRDVVVAEVTATVAAHRWDPRGDWSAHDQHVYDGTCAVCRGRISDIVALVIRRLEGDGWSSFPTLDAYEAACRALERHRDRADRAEKELHSLRGAQHREGELEELAREQTSQQPAGALQ
ncbi:MAG TPA: hypothetical protein VFP72_16380, partial [Kineosporiaceae bacterium]|nr:hypothetical protein [Kineosporiaceae bacterium]